MTFPEKLKQQREQAGMSQPRLAEVSGVPVSSLRNYEQGIRQPAWDVLLRLSRAMRCSADVFAECVEGLPPAPVVEAAKRR